MHCDIISLCASEGMHFLIGLWLSSIKNHKWIYILKARVGFKLIWK